MKKTLVTKATFFPFEVEELKLRPELRISGTPDDLMLSDLMMSAVEAYQELTDNVLCSSVWDLYWDQFPDEFELPAPVLAIDSLNYTDTNGDAQTVDAADYVLDNHSDLTTRLTLAYGESWPSSVLAEINVVRIRATLGYANPASIPRRIRDGLILKIQELYYGGDLSGAYEACWASYRRSVV